MARISICLKRISAANQLARCAQRELREIENEMFALKRGLEPDLQVRCDVGERLDRLLTDLRALRRQTSRLYQVSENALTAYRTAERNMTFNLSSEKDRSEQW